MTMSEPMPKPMSEPPTLTERMWSDVADVYAAILRHPFVSGLTDGSLDPAAFAFYLAQDAHYLRAYARVLALLAARAPSEADTALFARHAAGTIEVERTLHTSLLAELGLDEAVLAATPVAPTNLAYTSYLLATTYGGSFAEGLGAVLPCYWIYAEVGAALVRRGSPDPRYQRWIDTYAGPEFAVLVAEVKVLTDRVGAGLSSNEDVLVRRHFRTTTRYEWMFWDAAYRQQAWPI